MAEVLRDLVVSLSLKTDNFSRNINSINRQIREAESAFRLAGAGIDKFGNTTTGMSSRLSMLQTNLGHQREVVGQWERALATANSRLQESHTRYQDYTNRLEEARKRHQELGEELKTQERYLQETADFFGKDSADYIVEAEAVERLRAEYAASGEEVTKLEGQVNALQRTMQRNADAVTRAQTELNNARAAVRETEAEIQRLTQRLRIQNSAWTQAGAALTRFSTRMTAIGKSATTLGRRMTVMLTTPIVALGKKIVQASLDFESSFAYVRKTVQATEEQYDQLAAASKRMSTQIATSTSDINHVMATGGQLGIATEHIEEFSRVMIDLANSSTDLDADTAATNLAKFANIMHTDQALFKNIGSTVAELGNNFATTEEPIVTMAMRIAGAGKQIGLTEPQVLGLAAALSSVGIQAQAGGSSMSKALINMEVAARTGGDALKDFAMVSGMTEKEFVEQWSSDPVQVFQKFIEGLGKMDDEGASAVKALNLVPANKLTAETIIAYDADGTLHVLIMPEIGSPEAVEESVEQMGAKIGKGNAVLEDIHFFSSTDEDIVRISSIAESVDALKKRIAELQEVDDGKQDWSTIGDLQTEASGALAELDTQLRNLNQEDIANIGQEAAQLMAALGSGELDSAQMETYAAELQKILDLVTNAESVLGEGNPVTEGIANAMTAYDWSGDATTIADSLRTALASAMPQVGSDASAGVGQGLGQYSFAGDASTAASNVESAYRSSLQSHSPSQRMVPLGNDVSAGVGQGMTQYSFAGDANAAAGNLMSALSGALAAQASTAASSARSIGSAISRGIASGIRSGQSSVIQAAVQAAWSALAAAKAALDIHSPSGVFRDEVGLMAMKGLGEGFLEGEREQARIIRNAARYLTEEAQSGIVVGNTHNDNRQTIQQHSSVNLTGNNFYVRSDQDVHDLAVEIATLTRTQQRGRGLRMA